MATHRTPFRYPGGKQRLSPFIGELLEHNDLVGCHYAEPYAGGAGIALELLLSNMVSHVHLNDSSIHVYAVWHSITTRPDEFCRRISTASLDLEEWKRRREVVRHPHDHSLLDLGFSTFYLNRCNRSGILTAGVIGGIAQTGRWRIDARFPRNELIRRVEAIATKGERVSVTNLDAEEFMSEHAADHLPDNALVYCDPPYYERSQRLYLDCYQQDDHARLAQLIQTELNHRWVVSYDGHPDVIAFYKGRRKFLYDLQYSAVTVHKGREVFIFSDDLIIPRLSRVRAINLALAGARI
jgi:DNA adenine methylase